MRDEADEDIYHYRNLVETMFSVLKKEIWGRTEGNKIQKSGESSQVQIINS